MTRLEARRKQMEEEKVHGPLLRIDELTHEERSIINAGFIELCKRRKASDPNEFYQAYIDTLHHWKVMCPHPQPQRVYEGNKRSDLPLSFDEHRWFDCNLCGAAVINR